jgi:hypothetical protein
LANGAEIIQSCDDVINPLQFSFVLDFLTQQNFLKVLLKGFNETNVKHARPTLTNLQTKLSVETFRREEMLPGRVESERSPVDGCVSVETSFLWLLL